MSHLLETPVFNHWRPTWGPARKRAASARTLTEPSARGRPRRNAHSTYANAPEDQVVEEPAVKDQPPAAEDQPAPDPTPEQVLQQLQAQLQSTQQERDRLVATFAAN
jgi:hypothetical protein